MATAAVLSTSSTTRRRSSRRLQGLPAEITAVVPALSLTRTARVVASSTVRNAAALSSPFVPDVVSSAKLRQDAVDKDGQLPATKKTRRSTTKPSINKCSSLQDDATSSTLSVESKSVSSVDCLPRTREKALLSRNDNDSTADNDNSNTIQYVLGVDEAGRGPLAGPVVAAAVWCPTNIAGIVDSKKITSEATREVLYEQIVASSQVKWAMAIVDATTIDEINILQATLLGMRLTLQALVQCDETPGLARADHASIDIPGTYVVTNWSNITNKEDGPLAAELCYALIDGNRLPTDLPCAAETMVKGDGREYAIAAASILAKVTRDRLMHQYDARYPVYGLRQHKGYPTAAHMAAVHAHGASPIHRRSFAPLKHWLFDQDGKIIGDKPKEEKKKRPVKTIKRAPKRKL